MYNQPNQYNTPYQSYSDKTPLTSYDDSSPISEAPPSYSENDDGKFPDPRNASWRDLIFVILFVFHLLGIFVLFIVGFLKDDGVRDAKETELYAPAMGSEFRNVLLICLSSVGVGGCMSFFWIWAIKKFARQLIIGTLIASVIFWILSAIFLFVQGAIIAALFTLIGAIFNALFFYWWRARIPFATAMLNTVSARIQEYPATTYTAYVSLILQIVWVLFWVWTAALSQNFASNATIAYIFAVFLVLSFYWTAQVIKNVVHVTASGTFATWYFLHGTVGVPPNPTLKSLKRACTTSFGSICLGSLLVALLKTLRTIVRSMRTERNEILVCIADCLIGILDNLLRYFNIYAFTQVAIYGKSYCKAAKDTWNLIQSHGVEAIINDNLISGVLTMGAVLGGVVCAAVSAIIALETVRQYWITCAVLGFAIGFAMTMTAMEVVESGVATIFVCFAMDPLALKRNDPVLYNKFQETYSNYLHFV